MHSESRRSTHPSRHKALIQAAAASYATAKTSAFLEKGAKEEELRSFCSTCPATLVCAAAGVELAEVAPSTAPGAGRMRRWYALRTLQHLSINVVDHDGDICFGKVIGSIDNGLIMPEAPSPHADDPLEPRSLLWLADRVRSYMGDAAGRLQAGQRI